MAKRIKVIKDKLKHTLFKKLIEPPIDPDIEKKETYNQKIQWLLVYDKNPLKIKCSDKLEVKKYIEEKLGSDHFTPKTYAVGNSVQDLVSKISNDWDHPTEYLIKANNNSGNVVTVKDNKKLTRNEIRKLEASKYRAYGRLKDEWFYSGIEYKCFSEELLGENIADYKIECSDGKPRFCRYVWDRRSKDPGKEVCVDLNGKPYDFHLDENFKLVKKFIMPNNWEKMLEIAEVLSKDFKYVRVDMYNTDLKEKSDNSIYIGELTFAPKAGRYTGNGQVEAGKLLIGI